MTPERTCHVLANDRTHQVYVLDTRVFVVPEDE